MIYRDSRDFDFRGENLQGRNFQGENFEYFYVNYRNTPIVAQFQGANLIETNFQGVNLHGAEFQGAYLRNANLQSAILRGAGFQGADLRDANLQNADLHESSFKGAKLHGANLRECQDYQIADWTKAEYDNKTQFPDDFNPYEHGLIKTRRRGESVTRKSKEQVTDELHTKINTALSEIRKSIQKRQGQEKFRNALITYYEGRCAISGCEVTGVLEAAHIEPYGLYKNNHTDNGILLRADLHTLFDLNLIVIHPESKKIEIKPTLRSNEDYQKFDGIVLPSHASKIFTPGNSYLEWRYNNYEQYIGKILQQKFM
ncbi:pentapeptide repeat-containing protein [Anabaena sp. CCY 0017]|uniref:pentapeptide repeat-containing protein n=1 Tax=Anabaena sp. CCY 0017 TaxID=3103866 RepID=UPI0039C72178